MKECKCRIDLAAQLSNNDSPHSPYTQPLSAFFFKSVEPQTQKWTALRTLTLEGAEIRENSGSARRGHLLLLGMSQFVK